MGCNLKDTQCTSPPIKIMLKICVQNNLHWIINELQVKCQLKIQQQNFTNSHL
jgi:hypothetical protein